MTRKHNPKECREAKCFCGTLFVEKKNNILKKCKFRRFYLTELCLGLMVVNKPNSYIG